jgi:hypothetical protein
MSHSETVRGAGAASAVADAVPGVERYGEAYDASPLISLSAPESGGCKIILECNRGMADIAIGYRRVDCCA